MKFMFLILTFVCVLTEGIQHRKIFRIAVFYDQQGWNRVTFWPATGKNESTRDHILRLVQKANNLLNEADMHIQLMMNVSELAPIHDGSTTDQYWHNVRQQMQSIFSGSTSKSTRNGELTHVALILSYHPAMREERNNPIRFDMLNSPCTSALPSFIPLGVLHAIGERAADMIAAKMAACLLFALGMDTDSCISDYGMIHLPLCAVNFTQSLGGYAFSCFTDAPVVVDQADAICNNSIREAGEECDCRSCDSDVPQILQHDELQKHHFP